MMTSWTTESVLPPTTVKRIKPNPNEISISASIRAFTPKSDEAFHASKLWPSEALRSLSEVHRLVSTCLPDALPINGMLAGFLGCLSFPHGFLACLLRLESVQTILGLLNQHFRCIDVLQDRTSEIVKDRNLRGG